MYFLFYFYSFYYQGLFVLLFLASYSVLVSLSSIINYHYCILGRKCCYNFKRSFGYLEVGLYSMRHLRIVCYYSGQLTPSLEQQTGITEVELSATVSSKTDFRPKSISYINNIFHGFTFTRPAFFFYKIRYRLYL